MQVILFLSIEAYKKGVNIENTFKFFRLSKKMFYDTCVAIIVVAIVIISSFYVLNLSYWL